MSFFFCNFAAEIYVLMNYKTLYVCLIIALAQVLCAGMMQATEAGTGVFSVREDKVIRFANAPEAGLVQWATANAWREDQKNADGHNGWFVLDHSEWTYLLTSGRTNAANLNNLGIIAGDSGLIILPDHFVQPSSVPTFKPVDQGIHYEKNKYTAEQWAVMADAGAVFLPCQGYKEGETIKDAGDHGAYWSSDQYSSEQGYSIHFNEGEIHDQNTFASKSLYYSVILVQEVTILDEEDDAATYFSKWGAAKGKDFAYVRRTLKKDSTLYTLCLPFDVPDIEDSPLAGAEVFEFKGGRVSGTTGNERLFLQLSRLNGKRLTQGVPYLLRWAKTSPVETLSSPLYFANVENWDTDTTTAAHPGNETIKLRGVYPKTHIPDYTEDPGVAHYNFFLGANNTLYWPDRTLYPTSDMKGFRAYFYITAGSYPASAPKYRNMPVVWQIGDGLSSPTDIGQWTLDNGQWTKQLRNGKIVLVIDGKEFDLQGKQLK